MNTFLTQVPSKRPFKTFVGERIGCSELILYLDSFKTKFDFGQPKVVLDHQLTELKLALLSKMMMNDWRSKLGQMMGPSGLESKNYF